MTAYASYEPPNLSLSRACTLVGVYRYSPSSPLPYQYLPNIRLLAIQYREGPDPGVARFRYVFDGVDPSTAPTSFEQALSVDCVLANVVKNDERLVVLRENADGSTTPLFDGFAQVPELTLTSSQELVTFVAYGVAVREWDTPISNALVRDADRPAVVSDVVTDIQVCFNPGGKPNASPLGADFTDRHGNSYPTFLDPLVVRDPDVRRFWTLPMAVRYLCFRGNAEERYVKNPSGELIDSLLDSRSPIAGVTMDPSDPSSYESHPILVPDSVVSSDPWPVALHELLEPNGFGMIFQLEADLSGDPVTRLTLFRRQDASLSGIKDLLLQQSGARLDPGLSNVAQARLARDTSAVANIYTVSAGLERYEASFVLSPGFKIQASDAADATSISAFDRSSPQFSQVNRDKYRLFVFDETGEGHWDFGSASTLYTATSMSSLFVDSSGRPLPWVKRRRVPSGELFSRDSSLKPIRARLAVSTDYSGPKPGLWDGSGTWQPVAGGFELLKDRLGVWVSVPNPNAWNIGEPTSAGMPFSSGLIRTVEALANPGAARFSLRLTCVIDGDVALKATAGQRPSSSTIFPVTRFVDGRGRYERRVVAPKSEFNPTKDAVVIRDDRAAASSEASARRLAGEAGEVAGAVVIPRFTCAYQIGDKIRSILGRSLSLRTNAGAPEQEGEVFPSVVGLTWDFDGKQQTTLQLSDHRGEH